MMKNNHCVIALSAAIISLSCVNCQDARHGRQYKIIKDIAELQNTESLDEADLSSLDLRDCEDLFLGKTMDRPCDMARNVENAGRLRPARTS